MSKKISFKIISFVVINRTVVSLYIPPPELLIPSVTLVRGNFSRGPRTGDIYLWT